MRRCRPLLGTFVEIEGDQPEAVEVGFDAIASIHKLMSAHEPDSQLSRINRSAHLGWVELSEPTATVLTRALHWARASDGQFDIVRAGANALNRAALPLHAGQPNPDQAADWTDVTLDHHAIRLARPACLDVGGIAKGFAVDRAVEAMIAAGATQGLVNAGGDLRGFGVEPWRIDIVEPATRQPMVAVDLRDMALATSAGLPAVSSIEFGHLLDSNRQWASVTVQAPNCCDADALTKILWAGGSSSPQLLCDHGATAFAICADGRVEEIGQGVMA